MNNHKKNKDKKEKIRGDMSIKNVDVYYGDNHAIKDVSMEIKQKHVTAFIGPSGCGKSTLLRCLNRMNDEIVGCKTTGKILWGDIDILGKSVDPVPLRRKVGMVFQKPNPFPTMSIFDNVASGLKLNGVKDKKMINEIVKESLQQAALWTEVQDELHKPGMSLSGGQQQRLCIARALAMQPEILLMDEPTSALDPIASSKIEYLIHELKKNLTIVIVTHNMQQATRVADYTAFMYLGELVEFGKTKQIFEKPKKELTERYISGKFG